MSDANWPIRVGGEYRSISHPKQYKHVTCIDGDTVHFDRMFVDSPKVWGVGSLPASVFRDMHSPEDQSPLDDLISALKFVKQWFLNLEATAEPDDPLYAMRKRYHAPVHAEIDAALAKAKTPAVPEAEEVAA